jgi:hypothetical protein
VLECTKTPKAQAAALSKNCIMLLVVINTLSFDYVWFRLELVMVIGNEEVANALSPLRAPMATF